MEAIKKLLKYETTAVKNEDIKLLHELDYHKAIFICYKTKCQDGYTVIKKGYKKGTDAKIKQWLKYGTIRLN